MSLLIQFNNSRVSCIKMFLLIIIINSEQNTEEKTSEVTGE